MVMISAGYSLQHLEAGLQFLARDGGRVIVLRAPNPNHYTGDQWQDPGPLVLQEKNSHKDGK